MGQSLGGRARRRVGIIQQCPETENNRLQKELKQERITEQNSETEINALRNELEQQRIAEQSLETVINRLRNELKDKGIANQSSETEINRLRNELEQKRIAEQSLETVISRLRNELEGERTAKQSSETEISGLRNELEQKRIAEQSLETTINRLRNELEQEKLRFDERQSQLENEWVINSSDIHMSDDKLGEGAWGIVYSGKFLDCAVAVKQIHEVIDNESRHLFLREIKMASKCRHPCLLLFIGAIMGERTLLVTELMECSLRSKLFPGRGEETLAKDDESVISLDVALALHYLHEKKPDPILHNDVSSANVLLWRSATHWRAKLSDYGTANIVRRSNINYAGAAVYCAPEFIDTDNAGAVMSCKVSMNVHSVIPLFL